MARERLRKARPDDLAPFEALLEHLRARPELTEQRSVGTFHRGSRSFLHFHADDASVFADVKIDGEWERVGVSDDGGAALARQVDAALEGGDRG